MTFFSRFDKSEQANSTRSIIYNGFIDREKVRHLVLYILTYKHIVLYINIIIYALNIHTEILDILREEQIMSDE